MYVERIKTRRGDKIYRQILLRESYRVPGDARSKVKHRTLLNLTKCPPQDVKAIEIGLKYKNNLSKFEQISSGSPELTQGKSIGAEVPPFSLDTELG